VPRKAKFEATPLKEANPGSAIVRVPDRRETRATHFVSLVDAIRWAKSRKSGRHGLACPEKSYHYPVDARILMPGLQRSNGAASRCNLRLPNAKEE